LPHDRNKYLDATSVEEEPKPQPEAARSQPEDEPELGGASQEPRTTLPAVIPKRALATWDDVIAEMKTFAQQRKR